MTTEEIVTRIQNATRPADVVNAIAEALPPQPGMDFYAIRAAVADKWSDASYYRILVRAWKAAEQRAVQP